jgi:hypothetical protein
MSAERDRSVLLAMVALRSASFPEMEDLLQALGEKYPCQRPEEVMREGDNAIFSLGPYEAVVSLMPAPIPWDDLRDPCAAAWWWPDAAQAMRAHQAHLIVGLMGDAGSALDRHLALTDLVAAVAARTDAAGIYWGAGGVVHEPAAFQEDAAQLTSDSLAPHLWIDLRLMRNEDGSLRFFTTGMQSLEHREVEVDRCTMPPAELLSLCHDIVHYILTSGAKINDGDTIGRSVDEQITVRYQPSMWGQHTVMKLLFD